MKVSRQKAFANNMLKVLVVGGLVTLAATNPLFGVKIIGALAKEFKKKSWKDVKTSLYYLKRRGFIEVKQNHDGSYSVKATKAGRNQAKKYHLDDITIKAPKNWDRQWHIITFDIPVKKQKNRLALLSKLKELGFIMLQKSVWAHPFECHNEVVVLARAFEIDSHINYLTCSKISAEDYLIEEFFKRQNIVLK